MGSVPSPPPSPAPLKQEAFNDRASLPSWLKPFSVKAPRLLIQPDTVEKVIQQLEESRVLMLPSWSEDLLHSLVQFVYRHTKLNAADWRYVYFGEASVQEADENDSSWQDERAAQSVDLRKLSTLASAGDNGRVVVVRATMAGCDMFLQRFPKDRSKLEQYRDQLASINTLVLIPATRKYLREANRLNLLNLPSTCREVPVVRPLVEARCPSDCEVMLPVLEAAMQQSDDMAERVIAACDDEQELRRVYRELSAAEKREENRRSNTRQVIDYNAIVDSGDPTRLIPAFVATYFSGVAVNDYLHLVGELMKGKFCEPPPAPPEPVQKASEEGKPAAPAPKPSPIPVWDTFQKNRRTILRDCGIEVDGKGVRIPDPFIRDNFQSTFEGINYLDYLDLVHDCRRAGIIFSDKLEIRSAMREILLRLAVDDPEFARTCLERVVSDARVALGADETTPDNEVFTRVEKAYRPRIVISLYELSDQLQNPHAALSWLCDRRSYGPLVPVLLRLVAQPDKDSVVLPLLRRVIDESKPATREKATEGLLRMFDRYGLSIAIQWAEPRSTNKRPSALIALRLVYETLNFNLLDPSTATPFTMAMQGQVSFDDLGKILDIVCDPYFDAILSEQSQGDDGVPEVTQRMRDCALLTPLRVWNEAMFGDDELKWIDHLSATYRVTAWLGTGMRVMPGSERDSMGLLSQLLANGAIAVWDDSVRATESKFVAGLEQIIRAVGEATTPEQRRAVLDQLRNMAIALQRASEFCTAQPPPSALRPTTMWSHHISKARRAVSDLRQRCERVLREVQHAEAH